MPILKSGYEEMVCVAIDKDKGSQHALKWAIDHLVGKGKYITLLHVNNKPSSVSAPLGSFIVLNDGTNPAARTYRNDVQGIAKELFLPFRCFCTRKDVEVLSCIRHPNMVLLLGACPEYGCLVYEYMSNGSLDDCLFRRGNTPALPWQLRFRIAAEIGTGLLFHIERAIKKGTFTDLLDPEVPDWPVDEALSFAKLALQCTEMKRKDRPDLATVVLPELERLRTLAEETMPNIQSLMASSINFSFILYTCTAVAKAISFT